MSILSYSVTKYDSGYYSSFPLKLQWAVLKCLHELQPAAWVYLLQVCHYLMAGQVKSVKPCLKQLQQSIQTIMQPTWPSDESELLIQYITYLLRKLSHVWSHFIYSALIPRTYFPWQWILLSALRQSRINITYFSSTLCLYVCNWAWRIVSHLAKKYSTLMESEFQCCVERIPPFDLF